MVGVQITRWIKEKITISPNHRITDDQQLIDDFELCNCYFCISFFEHLIRKNKKNDRKYKKM